MTVTYRITTQVEMDEWAVEALKWAYQHLGMTAPLYSDDEFVSSVAHDLMHEAVADIKENFMEGLLFKVSPPPEKPLEPSQLAIADQLEELWIGGDTATRAEFLKRLGGWQTAGTKWWSLTLKAPLVRAVTI